MDKTSITVDLDGIEGDVKVWQKRIRYDMYMPPWTGLQYNTMQKLRERINADDGVYFLQRLIDRLM